MTAKTIFFLFFLASTSFVLTNGMSMHEPSFPKTSSFFPRHSRSFPKATLPFKKLVRGYCRASIDLKLLRDLLLVPVCQRLNQERNSTSGVLLRILLERIFPKWAFLCRWMNLFRSFKDRTHKVQSSRDQYVIQLQLIFYFTPISVVSPSFRAQFLTL